MIRVEERTTRERAVFLFTVSLQVCDADTREFWVSNGYGYRRSETNADGTRTRSIPKGVHTAGSLQMKESDINDAE